MKKFLLNTILVLASFAIAGFTFLWLLKDCSETVDKELEKVHDEIYGITPELQTEFDDYVRYTLASNNFVYEQLLESPLYPFEQVSKMERLINKVYNNVEVEDNRSYRNALAIAEQEGFKLAGVLLKYYDKIEPSYSAWEQDKYDPKEYHILENNSKIHFTVGVGVLRMFDCETDDLIRFSEDMFLSASVFSSKSEFEKKNDKIVSFLEFEFPNDYKQIVKFLETNYSIIPTKTDYMAKRSGDSDFLDDFEIVEIAPNDSLKYKNDGYQIESIVYPEADVLLKILANHYQVPGHIAQITILECKEKINHKKFFEQSDYAIGYSIETIIQFYKGIKKFSEMGCLESIITQIPTQEFDLTPESVKQYIVSLAETEKNECKAIQLFCETQKGNGDFPEPKFDFPNKKISFDISY